VVIKIWAILINVHIINL